MTILRIVAAAFALTMGLAFASGSAAASGLQCKHNTAEYAQVIRHFESETVKARALADRNPLYESDVAYYASVLADARSCYRTVGPVATASR
ncbi:MAG: hypothetical protein GEU95_17180 [Rhizobiales bacterium]|nr:hypothetical protein [Hyphomicrobiales bacterium]